LLFTIYWLFSIICCFIICYLLRIIYVWSLIIYYLYYSLYIIRCSLRIIHYSLFMIYHLLY